MILKAIGYVVALSLIACVYYAIKKHAVLKASEQCSGRVIGLIPRRGSKGRTNYAMEIEYTDRSGALNHFITASASNPASRNVGDEVTVFKHADGTKPDVLVFEETYLGLWLWFCVGLCVVGCFAAPTLLRLIYLQK